MNHFVLTLSLLALGAASLLSAAAHTRTAGSPDVDPAFERKDQAPPMKTAQKIVTFLWFDKEAEDAVRFYTAIFKDGKVESETRWGEGGPLPKGTLMSAKFRLAGQEFMALNGGPAPKFTDAISLFVSCESQEEIDSYWEKLTAGGGKPGPCGWLVDKFGVSWQVVPVQLGELLFAKDPEKAKRVGAAMMQMSKLDIRRLQQAYDGR
jgi:predicted 3-demethylubiquinone-9 3-methyltransferase (glyoxalase superfamily)